MLGRTLELGRSGPAAMAMGGTGSFANSLLATALTLANFFPWRK